MSGEELTEGQIEAAMQTLELYKAQLDALGKQQELIRASIAEHEKGLETIRQYKGAEEGEEILVPIGAGSYITAKVGRKKLMLAIGAEYYAGEDLEKGEEEFLKRIEELNQSFKKVDESVQQLTERATQLSLFLNDYYSKHR